MPQTFDQLARIVHAHCPLAGALLAENFIQRGYKRVCGEQRWSWLKGYGFITVNTSRSGTYDFDGDATVTGDSITFVAADVGRQIRFGSVGLPRTITAVDTVLNTATVSPPGGNSVTAGTATILDAFFTAPSDFASFEHIVDSSNDRPISWWHSQDELSTWDPDRSRSTGEIQALVAHIPSPVTATLGQFQYEIWPYQTAALAASLQYIYQKQPEDLTRSLFFNGPLRAYDNVLFQAAMLEAAEWPGPSADKPNPYFNLKLAERKEERYLEELGKLEVKDQEMAMTWYDVIPAALRRSLTGPDFRASE